MADTGQNIAIIYQEQGKFEEALEIYELALATQIRVCGQDHPNVAKTEENIGIVYYRQAKYEEALVQYGRALEIETRVLGHDHLDVAKSYLNIGIVYDSQGKYKEALVQYGRALEIKIRVLGQDHPTVAGSYGNIGNVYQKQGKYEEALVRYCRTLEIKIRVFGNDHRTWPHRTIISGKFTGNRESTMRHDEALEMFQKDLEITTGYNHPDVAQSYYNMACAHAPHDKLLCRDMLLKAERTGCLSALKQHMATDSDLDVVRESEWFKDLISRL